ncbi:MAG: hypothetical protein ABIA04_00495 [Pseudomonadota bacterium]
MDHLAYLFIRQCACGKRRKAKMLFNKHQKGKALKKISEARATKLAFELIRI